MSAKIVLLFLCTVFLAKYCSGTPPEGFKYRKPLYEFLLQEYEIMNWKVIDYGKTVLQAYEDQINCCMNASIVEVQQFLSRIVQTKVNIEEASHPTRLFKLSLLQDAVLGLVEPNSKMPEQLYKDISAIKETIKAYKTEYLEKFNASISGYFAQLSAARCGRESVFVEWFENWKELTAIDLKLQKIYQYFLARFQVRAQKFYGRRELNRYVFEQYERFFCQTNEKSNILDYHRKIIECQTSVRNIWGDVPEEPNISLPECILNKIDVDSSSEQKYLRVYECRTVFYTQLEFSENVAIAVDAAQDPYYNGYSYKSCLSEKTEEVKAEALKSLQIFIKAVSEAFDNYFEYQTTGDFVSSLPFIWFECFDGLSGWEQLRALDEYMARIDYDYIPA